jgi:erythromycin esterase
MGEATHGTWEFQALRHRLVRTLVAEHGLRAVAFEDNFAGLRPADEYVRRGEGDLATAMDAFGDYVFHTAEVRSMLAWLRSYNESRAAGDRVGVYGVDMQTAGDAARRVRAYLRRVDRGYLDAVDDRLTAVVESSDHQFDEAEVELLLDLAADLRSRLEDHRAAYVAASSRTAWQLARRHARVIEQSGLRGEAQLEGSTAMEKLLEGFEVRERMMAENADWIAEFVGGPIAFWAHNSHVGDARATEMGKIRDELNIGQLCREAYGANVDGNSGEAFEWYFDPEPDANGEPRTVDPYGIEEFLGEGYRDDLQYLVQRTETTEDST